MEINYLEQKLREQSESEAFNIFLRELHRFENMSVLNQILLPKDNQFTEQNGTKIKGHEIYLGIFLSKSDIPKIEENIDLLTEKIYEGKIKQLLEEAEPLEYLFEQNKG